MTPSHTASDKIHLFSSHAWKHGHRRDELHRLIQPVWIKGLDYEDHSITWRHPLDTETDIELARALRDTIAGVDALLIMAGMYANNRRWMMFEIDMAFAQHVPIIPILWNGQERVPQVPVKLASCEPVRWRGDSIREAIISCISIDRRRMFEAKLARRAALARTVPFAAGRPVEPYYPFGVEPQHTIPLPFFPQERNALAGEFEQLHWSNDAVFNSLGRFGRR